MSAFEKGQKNGCWQELNCLISIPTLNIYLKVKLKPLQKLKTGCVNTMLSIYSDHRGKQTLPKHWKTLWEHGFESWGHPKLPVSAELQRAHRGPEEKLVMRHLIALVPAPATGWAQQDSVLLLFLQVQQPQCSSLTHNGLHLPHCGYKMCPSARELSSQQELAHGWHTRMMPSFWLCCRHAWSYHGGHADKSWDTNQL